MPAKSEMRLDPLSGEWTVFSEARRIRPPLLPTDDARPETKPVLSPFLAGLEELTPPAVYTANQLDSGGKKWQVRVVPNRAPILRVEGETESQADGFYDRRDGLGAHEIVIEHPGALPLEALDLPAFAQVIEAWKLRTLDLMRDARLRHITVVKDHGAAAGAGVAHAVSQVIALPFVPENLKRRLRAARAFYRAKNRSIFTDILAEEIRATSRLVYENNGFAVLCPYASRAPFAQMILPKRQYADFHGISDQELLPLADALRNALAKMNAALHTPAYHLLLWTAPTRTGRGEHWATLDRDFRWHLEVLPRLYPQNAVELATGLHVNTVWPEEAAAHLREIKVPA